MAEARGRANWQHTAAVLSLIANVNRDAKKTTPFSPADFNPYQVRQPAKRVSAKIGMAMLKAVFVDHKGGPQ